jgi:hypothetical protein
MVTKNKTFVISGSNCDEWLNIDRIRALFLDHFLPEVVRFQF